MNDSNSMSSPLNLGVEPSSTDAPVPLLLPCQWLSFPTMACLLRSPSGILNYEFEQPCLIHNSYCPDSASVAFNLSKCFMSVSTRSGVGLGSFVLRYISSASRGDIC